MCVFLFFALFATLGHAQTAFTVADLPTQVGEFYRAYVNTNEVRVNQRLGTTGGPQRWDFSAASGPGDKLGRVDIVLPTDQGHGAAFPDAAYAERTTYEAGGGQSWSYFSILPDQGRAYYGFYDPLSNPVDPLTVFNTPTIDLPATITYTQRWNRTVDFQDVLDIGGIQLVVMLHFTSDAVVDAYGTLVLPGIGEIAALRVNEVNAYESTDITFGLPLGTTYCRNYYWLAKGIGKAVHIISAGYDSTPPEDFGVAKTVWRVFEASRVVKPKQYSPVKNLCIDLKGKEVFLSWEREPAASSYRIQFTDRLVPPLAWTSFPAVADNFHFDGAVSSEAQRYYRVDWAP